ncbi:MAG TPA: DUF72 domain-containing protein [Labilithrix sp.]
MSEVRVGTSGWRYAPWRGVFYPKELPQRLELAYAGAAMRTIEINGSFYSLQRPSCYAQWYDATPADFVFAVKGSRFMTHMKKLVDCEQPLANFFASGVLALEEKLGPILWQLPPQVAFDAERLARFFDLLPRTTDEAAALAARHDSRVRHGTYLSPRVHAPIRYALEIRHETFQQPAAVRLLRRHRIALCVADTAGNFPFVDDVTADFVYVRLHGSKKLYVSGYDAKELDAWAERMRGWRRSGRDVFAYFDNDVKVRAPFDAMNLAARLGQGAIVPFPRKAQRDAVKRRGVEEPRPIAKDPRWKRRTA